MADPKIVTSNPFQRLVTLHRQTEQRRDEAFQAALTAFRVRMGQLGRLQLPVEDYVRGMGMLRSHFDAYIKTLRQQGLVEFTLPMELSLVWVRTQWFLQFQGPQIRYGWQQAFSQFGR